MSRIHEALKKAEQDRSMNRVDRKLEEPSVFIESREPAQVATKEEVVVLPPPAAASASTPQPDPEIIQLAELRAKSVKSTWNPDPHSLVFSSGKDVPSGAE